VRLPPAEVSVVTVHAAVADVVGVVLAEAVPPVSVCPTVVVVDATPALGELVEPTDVVDVGKVTSDPVPSTVRVGWEPSDPNESTGETPVPGSGLVGAPDAPGF
jgi:hypothetical protein